MTGKDDISVVRHKTGITDASFGEKIIGRNSSRMIVSSLWQGILKRRFFPFCPLTLFYLSLSTGRSMQTANVTLRFNAYLNFFMKAESMKPDLTARTGSVGLIKKHKNIISPLSGGGDVTATSPLVGNDGGKYSQIVNIYSKLLSIQIINYHKAVFPDPWEDKPFLQNIVEKKFHIRKTDALLTNTDKRQYFSPVIFNSLSPAGQVSCFSESPERFLQYLTLMHKNNEYFLHHTVSKGPFSSPFEAGRMRSRHNMVRKLSTIIPVSLKNPMQPFKRNTQVFRETESLHELHHHVNFSDSLPYQDAATKQLIYDGGDMPARLDNNFRRNNPEANTSDPLRLDYLHPKTGAARENKATAKTLENFDAVFNKNQATTAKTNSKSQINNVDSLANEVYRMIENKLRIEKERRGIFR